MGVAVIRADTFDPNHINPWLAVALVLALLVWFAVLHVRDAIRDRDDKRAAEATAYYQRRKTADPTTLCTVLACRQPWTVVVYDRGFCGAHGNRFRAGGAA